MRQREVKWSDQSHTPWKCWSRNLKLGSLNSKPIVSTTRIWLLETQVKGSKRVQKSHCGDLGLGTQKLLCSVREGLKRKHRFSVQETYISPRTLAWLKALLSQMATMKGTRKVSFAQGFQTKMPTEARKLEYMREVGWLFKCVFIFVISFLSFFFF